MNLVKTLNIFFIITILALLPFGFTSYVGNKFYYLVFSLISSHALLISFNKNSISFESFFSLLLWLGFWFKFTVQISFLDSLFPEGIGIFDYEPNSYDDVLVISSVGIIGFIAARYFRLRFIFNYSDFNVNKFDYKNYLNFYVNYRKNIFILYFFLIIFFSITNFIFTFIQKGTVHETTLPFALNNFVNWLLMFGLASFSTLIIFFEFQFKKTNSNSMIKYGLFETFISSISILSRAMIFNSTAIIYGFYRLVEMNNIKIKKVIFLRYFAIVLVLFIISLLTVGKIRQSKDFPRGHEAYIYMPSIELNTKNKASNLITSAIVFTNNFTKEVNQIFFLVTSRWVGVEGVMAVSSKTNLNFDLFIDSFNDKFDYSNSFYENKIKEKKVIYKKEPKIFTVYVPGIIAFLFYTKSLIFLFFSIFILCIFCSIVEYFAYKMSKGNILFSYLIGNVLAYRLIHFGYLPQNTYKFLIAVLFNLFFIYFILKIIKRFNNK